MVQFSPANVEPRKIQAVIKRTLSFKVKSRRGANKDILADRTNVSADTTPDAQLEQFKPRSNSQGNIFGDYPCFLWLLRLQKKISSRKSVRKKGDYNRYQQCAEVYEMVVN